MPTLSPLGAQCVSPFQSRSVGECLVFLFTEDELDSFLGQRHCKAIAASEHDGPEHIVSSRALAPLDIVYLVVQSRSDVRVEVRHAHLTSKE